MPPLDLSTMGPSLREGPRMGFLQLYLSPQDKESEKPKEHPSRSPHPPMVWDPGPQHDPPVGPRLTFRAPVASSSQRVSGPRYVWSQGSHG